MRSTRPMPPTSPTSPAGSLLTPTSLAVLTQIFWGPAGVRLTVGFLDRPSAQLRRRILSHMNAWGAWANVQFTETKMIPQARIARLRDDGYWSYLGTDVLSIPADEPTMNLDKLHHEHARFRISPSHPGWTGYMLGLPHEHRRKAIVNRIDREKAIKEFMRTQGWSRQEVIEQALTPFDTWSQGDGGHDENSIMRDDLRRASSGLRRVRAAMTSTTSTLPLPPSLRLGVASACGRTARCICSRLLSTYASTVAIGQD